MTLLLKDPESTLDFSVDWGPKYLGADELVASDWSVEPSEDGAAAIASSSFTPSTANVKISGGKLGRIYRVRNCVETLAGLVDARSFTLRVEAM